LEYVLPSFRSYVRCLPAVQARIYKFTLLIYERYRLFYFYIKSIFNYMVSKTSGLFPQHIAIIMDGNGRWAEKHKLPRIEGHKKGAIAVRTIIEACTELKIPYLTLFVFSTENWNRPQKEINALFELIDENLEVGKNLAMDMGIKILHMGKMDGIPVKMQYKIKDILHTTRDNRKLNLVLAFNYGGRDEIVNAAREIVAAGLSPEEINETIFSNHLYSVTIPDPDLVIRTAGEMRLSNFLLWQAAYSEIYFSKAMWPDFNKKELMKAIEAYGKRERRFGTIPQNDVKS
jgi:undecaprenyl diphosphate synthase